MKERSFWAILGFDSEYLDFIEEASDRWSYFQRKGALTMFEQEVDYRLAKWLLADIAHQGVITHSEMLKAWEELLAYYDPPFAGVEVLEGNIGDGVTVDGK